eukprot:scpid109036/ scgid14396/ 
MDRLIAPCIYDTLCCGSMPVEVGCDFLVPFIAVFASRLDHVSSVLSHPCCLLFSAAGKVLISYFQVSRIILRSLTVCIYVMIIVVVIISKKSHLYRQMDMQV